MNLINHVAEDLALPAAKLKKWRRDRTITIRKIPGGWRLQVNHEPAASVITAAWKRRRDRVYGKK